MTSLINWLASAQTPERTCSRRNSSTSLAKVSVMAGKATAHAKATQVRHRRDRLRNDAGIFALVQAQEDDEERGHEDDGEARGGDMPLATAMPSEWRDAEPGRSRRRAAARRDERERRHQDRAKAQAGRPRRRRREWTIPRLGAGGPFHDEDRILRESAMRSTRPICT